MFMNSGFEHSGANFFQGRLFAPGVKSVIAQGPKPEYERDDDWADQYYLPARFLSACNPNTMVVLPEHRSLRDFVNWFQENVFRPRFNQALNVLWLDDSEYLLDRNVTFDNIHTMQTFLDGARDAVVFPYSTYSAFYDWFGQLNGVSLLGESNDFYRNFANKTILHPGSESGLDLSRVSGLRIPNGINCFNQSELNAAFDSFASDRVLLKDPFGSGGAGISLVSNTDSFGDVSEFPQMLEQCLELDTLSDGSELSLTVQFTAGEVMAVPTRQIVHGTHSAGNVIMESEFMHLYDDVMNQSRIVASLLSDSGMKGLGGVDFLFQDGVAYLVDVNLGRPTAAHPAWMTRDSHFGVDSNLAFATLDMPFDKNIEEAWSLASGFNSSDVRVMPLYHLQDMEARWIAFSKKGEFALRTLNNIRDRLI